MLTSISPLGEQGRGNRWSVTVGWLILGGIIGGSVVGAIAGGLGYLLIGSLDSSVRLVILAAIAIAAAGVDLAGVGFPGHRQVSEDWLTQYRSWVYGLGFGVQLGSGFATIVTTALVPATFAAAFLTGDVAAGALIGGVFGGARGATVLVNGRVHTAESLRSLHAAVDRLTPSVARAGAGVAAVVAGVAIVSAVGV